MVTIITKFKNKENKTVGEIRGKEYRSLRVGSKHKMRIYGGSWGIDKSILDSLVSKKCESIRIADSETKEIFSVTVEKFAEKGIKADYGHGEQVFLPVKYFEVTKL